MSQHNFDRLILRVKDLDPHEMELAAYHESRDVERYLELYCSGRDKETDVGKSARRYGKLLREFAWLLQNGTRPASVYDWDLPRMQPAIESLVRRRVLKPAALALFVEETFGARPATKRVDLP
jgi:hypothetical protein